MERRKAVFADNEILASYQANITSLPSLEKLEYKGWSFSSLHTKICDSTEHKSLARRVEATLGQHSMSNDSDNISVNGKSLRVPPMLFLHDICAISNNKSGATLRIDAEDALLCWAAEHTEISTSARPLRVAQVPFAKSWNQRSLGDIHANSSSSRGPISTTTPKNAIIGSEAVAHNPTQPLLSSTGSSNHHHLWDWTYCSDYCCSLHTSADDCVATVVSGAMLSAGTVDDNGMRAPTPFYIHRHAANAKEPGNHRSSTPPSFWRWMRANASGLDMDLLRQTDVPILMFDEITVYRDDLEDCGEATFDAKLRVMPECWFLLSRMFVRVDDVILKVRETRFFHIFASSEDDDAIVHVTVTWKELKVEDDVEHSWTSLKTLMLNPAAISEHLPRVNLRDDVHEFYTLA